MARPAVPRQTLDAALQALAGGATVAEAAARAGIGERTLKRYVAAQRASAAPAPQRLVQVQRAAPVEPPPSPALNALEAGEPEESLLTIIRAELRYARDQRKLATEDAAKRGWSKRVDELVRAVERFAPPPPPSPDLVHQEMLRQAARVWDILEEHLPEKTAQPGVAA